MPARDPAATAAFWEPLGFVAMPETDEPYPHQDLTSDGIDLGAALAAAAARAGAGVLRRGHGRSGSRRLRQAGVVFATPLPRGLAPQGNALLEAPEGTLLLLLTGTP